MNSTQQLTHFIRNNTPCIFAKYGDGEFNAANFWNGGNCDGTPYTKNLGEKVRESFIHSSQQPHAMMGAWHDTSNRAFWEGLGNQNANWKPVNWVDFHTVLIDNNKPIHHSPDRLNLFTAIKESTRKKIYVANEKMSRAKEAFSIDHHIVVDQSNWFDTNYDAVLNRIKYAVENDNTMILTSAGMGAKYLISNLHELYPNEIYIDIGSGFDLLCTKQVTRTYNPSYHELCQYLRPMLPPSW
jgi:hypothetical protein